MRSYVKLVEWVLLTLDFSLLPINDDDKTTSSETIKIKLWNFEA